MKEFSEEEINEIHEILHGRITGKPKDIFFEKMAKSPELEEEFEFWKKVEEAGRYNIYKKSAEAALSKVVEEEFEEVYATDKSNFISIFKNPRTLSIAASIVVLLTAGIAFWYKSHQDTQPTISDNTKPPIDSSEIEQHEALLPNKINTLDLVANNLVLPIENVPQKFSNAVANINEGKNESGINQLQAMNKRTATPTEKPTDDEIKFGSSGNKSVDNPPAPTESLSREEKAYQQLYLGIAYLKKADYKKALSYLENVTNENLEGEAKWYTALAFLGLNDIEKAKAFATQVADDGSNPHQAEAQLLIQYLQK